MSKEEQKTEEHDAGMIDSLPLTILAQYIKDLSFENPGAPATFTAEKAPTKTGVEFSMEARKIEDLGKDDDTSEMFEVILMVTVETKREDRPVFIAEVSHGSVVTMRKDVPEEQKHPLLLIEIPRLAFPFVRQTVNDLAMQGGYPPLLLQPVNFHKLYMERFAQSAQKAS